MTYPFNEDDRKLRPGLAASEIAAMISKGAGEQIKKGRDSTVRQTPTVYTDIDATGGGDSGLTVMSIVVATNIRLTGLKVNGSDVRTPPTLVVDNAGNLVLSIL